MLSSKQRITVRNRNMILFLSAVLVATDLLLMYAFHKISLLEQENQLLRSKPVTQSRLNLEDYTIVDPNLLKAVIAIESNGNTQAYNQYTGAVGLMQLTPVIYKNLCRLTKEEAFNPSQNVACGSLFLAHLLKKYRGNIEKTLLHYNNGHTITNTEYSDKVTKKLTEIKLVSYTK